MYYYLILYNRYYTNAYSLILGRKCPFYTKDGLGILESPNFPGEYPAGAECHWRVRPGRNKRVLVIISNIELDENCGDVLTIRKTGNILKSFKSMNLLSKNNL